MSDFQQPVSNVLPPVPAVVDPILDQLPVPAVPLPSLPRVPASAEAIAQAHGDMMDGELALDANARARLGLDGGTAGIDTRLRYGDPNNHVEVTAGASTESGVRAGTELALTNDELRMKLEANAKGLETSTPEGSVHAVIEGGDEVSGLEAEGGVSSDGNAFGKGKVRMGSPDGPHVNLTGGADQLLRNPDGTVAVEVDAPLAPGVRARGGANLTTGSGGTSGGGTVGVGVEAGPVIIDANGNMQATPTGVSGGAGVNIHGEF